MDRWNPKAEETFVFRHPGTGNIIVMLVPGGEEPQEVLIDECLYLLDEDSTDHTRMHLRVSNRKRGLPE